MTDSRGWQTAFLLAVGLAVMTGCTRPPDAPAVFVRSGEDPGPAETAGPAPQPAAAPAPPETRARRTGGKLSARILTPADGASVSWMETARFRVEGDLPAGAEPVLFVRDATGLDTNWWCYQPTRTSEREFTTGVQFGVPEEQGSFRLAVLLLPADEVPAHGSVGLLPAQPLAQSTIVAVSR